MTQTFFFAFKYFFSLDDELNQAFLMLKSKGNKHNFLLMIFTHATKVCTGILVSYQS